MAEKKKSFSELLSEAPLTAQEDTVSLVGALGRSTQAGKFVLSTGPGSSVTLDVSAVKGYQVLGGGVGQVLVQVDVDKEKVPAEVAEQAAAVPFALATPHHAAMAANMGMTQVFADTLHTPNALDLTLYAFDHGHTNPIIDAGPTGRFPHPD